MYKKVDKGVKIMFEFYKQNPALAQQDWHKARMFKEACNMFAEQVQHILFFDTKDIKLRNLSAKMYCEWVNERYLTGKNVKAYDEFLTEVLRNVVKKLIKDFNIDLSED